MTNNLKRLASASLILSLVLSVSLMSKAQTTDSLRILWVGNSYTFYNDLPDKFAELAAEQGLYLATTKFLKGGERFSGHMKNTKLIEAIKQGGWDYVILQEQSSLPAQSTRTVVNDCYPYARALDSLVMAHSPQAHVIFYMTWGHMVKNVNNKIEKDPAYPLDESYDWFQARLFNSYLEMTYENKAWCAPVGMAWKTVRKEHPEIELYSNDGSHPSLEGSYLAAHSILATILQKKYSSHIYFGIPQQNAVLLQKTALQTVLDNRKLLGLPLE